MATNNVINTTMPISVAQGGTGDASLTAYAVLCGGTTSTNPVQPIAAVGSSGQVLTSNGAAALPTFQAASSGGGWVLLSTVTASASATVNFDNFLTSTYDNYCIMFNNYTPATNAQTLIGRVGTGATPTYQSSGYVGSRMEVIEATPTGFSSATSAVSMCSAVYNSANFETSGIVYIFNAPSASKYKTIQGQVSFWQNSSPTKSLALFGVSYSSTTAITSFQFLAGSGNVTTGTFRLYGIKNS